MLSIGYNCKISVRASIPTENGVEKDLNCFFVALQALFKAKAAMASCDVCLDLNCDVYPSETVDAGSADLKSSAARGCVPCKIILRGIEMLEERVILPVGGESHSACPCLLEITLRRNRSLLVMVRSIDDDNAGKNYEFGLEFFSTKGKCRRRSCWFIMLTPADSPTPWAAFGASQDVPAQLGLDLCLDYIKKWIKDCDSHTDCPSPTATKLPRRVLDLRPHRFRNAISLVETEEGDVGTYITLSHRWGMVQPMKTTKDTLSKRKAVIRLADLPKTFHDAVTLCRGLGVDYLWIDSLCIIQGDKLDWERESAKMAAIYTNSYLNIAATRANDSTGGCLPDRWTAIDVMGSTQAIPLDSYEIMESHLGKPVNVQVRVSLEQGHDDFLRSFRGLDTRAPLLSRAWVFQERCLARRTLHFHAHELIWECKMGLMCECRGLDVIDRNKTWYPGWQARHISWKAAEFPNMADLWLEVVQWFTELDLTYESDRLPALSGIASRFSGPVLKTYLAGLWKEDLARSLLWFISGWKSSSSRPLPLGAPTWSWASISLNKKMDTLLTPFSGLGTPPTFHQDRSFRVLEAHCHSSTVNPFGGVSGGTLVIETSFNSAIMVEENTMRANTLLILDRDVVDEDDLVLISDKIMYPDVALRKANFNATVEPIEVYCLLVGSTLSDSTAHGAVHAKYALLVTASSAWEGAYERVGFLSTADTEIDDYRDWFHGSSVGSFRIH